jgi:hypothetical protein
MGGACGQGDERRGTYRVLMGRPEGKRLIFRPRLICEDNIEMG